MTRSELLALLAQDESSGLELKRDDITVEDLARVLVAFANLDGGTLLLGVADDVDHTVTGLTRDNVEEWVMTACRDKIRPPIIPYFEIVRDVESGKDVGVVRVTPGYAVHALWHRQRTTYYIRVGSLTREAGPEELEMPFQRRGGLRGELRPVSGTGLDDFDLRRLVDYFARVREQEVPDAADEDDWVRLLVNTEVMVEANHETSATVAGLLLFGRTAERFLPQTGIDAMAFPDTDRDYATRERLDLVGPMVGLFEGSGGNRKLVGSGLVEDAVSFVSRNTGVTASLEEGSRRIERPTYPAEVVREAVVNALVHRDYLLSGMRIELAVYANRLEVISPGRLPNGITPDRMRAGTRSSRNQLLTDVLRDYGYLERMGMGVSRKLVRGMREHNGTHPDLIEEDERFKVVLWA